MTQQVQFLLQDIKDKNIVLPEFQREFTWDKQQVKDLLDSLLASYPIGSFLIWKTTNPPALKNLPKDKVNGPVKVLLDGQQRLTALYLLMRDEIPPYYKKIKNKKDPRNLYYNLESQEMKYYVSKEMDTNPAWVSILDCFKGKVNPKNIAEQITEDIEKRYELYSILDKNLKEMLALRERELSIMRVDQQSKLNDALTVFDRVNTGGTPLTEADIALAYMCSNWKDTRREFKRKIDEMKNEGFDFDLKFMVRAMNAVVNYRAEYDALHKNNEEELKKGWERLDEILNYVINVLKNRAYIYSTRDLNTPNVLIPIIGYLGKNDGEFKDQKELNHLLYWMYAALYRSRYSGSVDQRLQEDLKALGEENPIEAIINLLEREEGSLEISKGEIQERGVRHPFYNMMNFVIRNKGGVDWANQLDLSNPFGDRYKVERHHIFPKSVLKDFGYKTGKNKHHFNKVHEIANRVPLTRSGNRDIFKDKPIDYLPKVREKNPGNLKKFLIPTRDKLWKLENYELFLEKRRELIAKGINDFMNSLIEEKIEEEDPEELLKKEESETLEFKSSLRWDYKRNRINKDLEEVIAKTIAAFLNTTGGNLLIGVDDNGNLLGLNKDYKDLGGRDEFLQKITQIINNYLGASNNAQVDIEFFQQDGKDICLVRVQKSPRPVYLKKGNEEKFYVRTQNSSRIITGEEASKFRQSRF